MLRRFVSAASVASVAVLLAALAVYITPGIRVQRIVPLIVAWLCAPAIWGIWALLAPKTWVPERLPAWGAVLGLAAGIFAYFVANAPLRMFDQELPIGYRAAGIPVVVVIYYLGWMIVRAVLKRLSAPPAEAAPGRSAARVA